MGMEVGSVGPVTGVIGVLNRVGAGARVRTAATCLTRGTACSGNNGSC